MTTKYLHLLEFDKIITMAAENCACPEAAEMLRNLNASTTTEEMREALRRTDAVTSLLIKHGNPRIQGVQNVMNIIRRAEKGGMLSMSELLIVAATLRNFKHLNDWYGEGQETEIPNAEALDRVFYGITENNQLSKTIFECILSENEMADTASDTLYDLRRKIRAAESAIRDKLDSIIRSPSTQKYLQDAIVSQRSGRFVVPVKAEFRSEISGVIHDVSSSGATLFVEPSAVVETNAKIMQLRSQEKEEIEAILSKFSNAVAALQPQFGYSYAAMLELDALIAKGRLAVSQNAAMPQVSDEMRFSLKKARHPLIDKKKVVPVDISIGRDYDALIITGPNTGGKTVSLKTAGLLLAMAACGFLIPASEGSEVCLFRDILVDIGDEQSIEQSLSTFSGHIKNIVGILAQAASDTLVLLDELGAGTDPAEGASLAVSIIETIRETGAKIMATTHYGELKVFALETPRVQNASCEFDVESLRPTYRLLVGVPGRSNAFLIGEKLGLPTEVIQKASGHLSAGDKRFETVLGQLEDLKAEIREDKEEIERLKYVAENQLDSAKAERDKLIQQGQNELDAMRRKAKQMEQSVQDAAYALLDEMKELQKQENLSASQKAQRARAIARKEAMGITEDIGGSGEEKQSYVPLTSAKPGQVVVVAEMGCNGTVKSAPDKNGMVEVLCGAIKTRVPLSGLYEAVQQQAPKKKKQTIVPRSSGSSSGRPTRSAAMEINLIGMTSEEAVMEADRFIDGAVMSGISPIYLIHGRGAGILRKAIRDHLKRHKSVKSFRSGMYGEGEDGVTVVELK